MKKISYNIYKILLPVLFLSILLMACKDEEVNTFVPDRQFSPGIIKATSGETSVTLEWNPSLFANGVNYAVEISKDSTTFDPVDFRGVTAETSILMTDDSLTVKQKYFARIKALGADEAHDSRWVASAAFSIKGEQILLPMQSSDIIDNAAIVKWGAYLGLTKIVITPVGGASVEIILTDADNASSFKLIKNLTSNTTYKAEIFKGNLSKGTISFSTKAGEGGGNLIDLRGFTSRPNVLFDTLPQISSGSVVILGRGITYNIPSTLNLSKSVTITSGFDLFKPDPAKIFLNSNFNITGGSTIDSLVFKDVTLTSDSYAGKYVFNVSNPATITKMKFESCKAEIFRGLVRLQAAVINVTDFYINNCVIDSISNYGVINIDNANCKVFNISIKNSTIYKAEKIVASKQNSTTVLIQNCTFNEAPFGQTGSTYTFLVDYSASLNVTSGISVSNCIFGVGKNNAGNTTVKGIRAGGSTAINVSGNYNTLDYVSAGNNIPSLTSYAGTSVALWQDPKKGDFNFKDTNFSGKSTAGDPRWRK